jgi:hypothetical protein
MILLPVTVVLVAEQPLKMAPAAALAVQAHNPVVLDIQQVLRYKVDLRTHLMAVVVVEAVAVIMAAGQGVMVPPQTLVVVVAQAITAHQPLLQQH